jgi:pyruvate formate lyase activating enzyme
VESPAHHFPEPLQEADREQSGAFTFYGLVPTTLIDYPGQIASTVFTIGCNFRCPYCHNRELVLGEKESLSAYSVQEVLDQIGVDEDTWIDGVCITGGEPLMSPGIETAVCRFKTAGLKVKIDTNGGFPEKLQRLIEEGLVDYVAMDVKAPLEEKGYSKAIGLPAGRWLNAVRESIGILHQAPIPSEFRTTCVPGLHKPETVAAIARDISPCQRYYLQKFRPHNTLDPAYEDVQEPRPQEMEDMLAAARQHVPAAKLR